MDVYILSVAPLSLLIRALNSSNAVLVNVPGGTQRILNSNKLKVGDISTVLLTNAHPYFLEGLSGLLQTLCNNGPPVTTDLLTSDPNVLDLLETLNNFAHTPYWDGHTVLFSKTYQDYSTALYAIRAIVLDSEMPLLFSIEYVVTKRKLDKKKIKELRLTGLQCKELAAGNTVVHEGVPIIPDDVSVLATTRSVIILMDTYYPEKTEQILSAVLELVQKEGSFLICASERYRPLLSTKMLKRNTLDIVYCADSYTLKSPNDPGVLTAYADFVGLRRIWNVLVPHALIPPLESCLASETPSLTRFFLSTALERFAPIRLSTLQDPISSLEIYPQYSGLLTETGPSLAPLACVQSLDAPGLLLLGTGASVPSKYRNVSGYLVVTSSRHTVCIDPGEGTLQLLEWAAKGISVSDLVVSLSFIGITHSHADHYLGLSSLVHRYLLEVMRLTTEGDTEKLHPLIILAGSTELSFLDHSLKTLEKSYQQLANMYLQILSREETNYLGRLTSLPEFLDGCQSTSYYLTAVRDIQFLCVPSDHIPGSISIFLRDNSLQIGIGISGDTRPSPAFVFGAQMLREANTRFLIIVHEATFADSEQDLAALKGHSTIGQAAEQIRKCGADVGIFTHFSQRYTKNIPELSSDKDQEDKEAPIDRPVCLYASDIMWLPIEQHSNHHSVHNLLVSIQPWTNLASFVKQLYIIADCSAIN